MSIEYVIDILETPDSMNWCENYAPFLQKSFVFP